MHQGRDGNGSGGQSPRQRAVNKRNVLISQDGTRNGITSGEISDLRGEDEAERKTRVAEERIQKTFHRLQRSQTAERVKTAHQEDDRGAKPVVKSGTVHQTRQCVCILSNVTRKVTESAQNVNPPLVEKKRKPSVSFKLDPVILQGDKTSSSCSGNESSGQEPSAASKTEAGGSSNPNHGKRSRLRLNKSARRVCTEPMATTSPEGRYSHKDAGSTRGSALCLNEDGPLQINTTNFNSMSRRVQASRECKNDLDVSGFVQQRVIVEDTIAPASPVF
ncbi:unnamed protein product [Ranitomeya imitator]|uniref:Uncharacterized protein n=1 Tax=Ranitomeya imitator TaxID=111125 RepID=A0ABN9LV60_9NEOB|nr:unnamed protein product [Ranitomeya imitator]